MVGSMVHSRSRGVRRFQAAVQQAGDAGRAAAHVRGHLGQGHFLPVVQHDRLALRLGQGGQRVGQAEQLFVPHGLLAG